MNIITIPKESVELAEFLGILFGDGSLLIQSGKKKLYRTEVTLNLKEDKEYSIYILNLIEKLFNIEPYLLERKKYNAIVIRIHSKKIAEFFSSQNFPIGRKQNKLQIPKWILKNKKFIKVFLRGFLETDGSLFFAKRGTYKTNKYPVIELKASDKFFINQVNRLLKYLGFICNVRNYKNKEYKVQLNGVKNLEKWVKEIGFRNVHYYSKYEIWKKFNMYKPYTNLEKRMNMLGWQNGYKSK